MNKIAISILLPLAVVLLCSMNAEAQDKSYGVSTSAAEYYSPKTGEWAYEVGIGYLFSKTGVKVNYGQIGLAPGRKVHEETISFYSPINLVAHTFSMTTEISAGIMHGHIYPEGKTSVLPQIQLGVSLDYMISRHTSCGFTFKSVSYKGNTIPLIGCYCSTHF